MDEQKKVLKEDINFLEYPTWIVDSRKKICEWIIEKPNGIYKIASSEGLPSHFDRIVLYSLLYKMNKTGFDTLEIETTRYEIAKNTFPDERVEGSNRIERIMTSLKKWKAVSINFEGVFYGDDDHTERGFSIIDKYVLSRKTKTLRIHFNQDYITQLKETKFYKLIDFEQYRRLHRASAARLYEVLVKNFKDRDLWAINIQGLAEKLTFEKRKGATQYYPSDVLRHLKPSITEIREKTELNIVMQYNKDTEICVFTKLKKEKIKIIGATKIKTEDSSKKKSSLKKSIVACAQYFKSLPDSEKHAILDGINRDQFLKYIPYEEERIFAYMSQHKLWGVIDEKSS